MKKLLLAIALIKFCFSANAQSIAYKTFKLDIDLGYVLQSVNLRANSGGSFTLEPHFRLSDPLALGFRFENALIQNNNDEYVDQFVRASYSITADYYLMNGGFRPFFGGGVGYFTAVNIDNNTTSDGSSYARLGSSKIGVFPRIGFESGHFRMASTYDILGSHSNYLTFTLGLCIGGGEK